ncbi:alkaline phosphatase D family protein [Pseudomonas aeruginosa]|uniref:alkaline phosphatase D family protein n=1 Tax=Pseudomonas aeruginosa TaxID=287 RepID=UPI00281AD6C4|nr:alkaline phosphatase D family protein [Pseudomonas aeruginosa]MDS1044026.1 alkaline phosphatase D family protein [Pseudomonas aeruginosa]HDV4149784.1 alkaline phosphatase family protein [Pseudomonas aeruginosa]
MSLLLGPILHFRGIHNDLYQVSALVVLDKGDPKPKPEPTNCVVDKVTRIASIPFGSPTQDVWRVDLSTSQKAAKSQQCSCSVSGGKASFYVPALGESPRVAYGSCNGFSADKYRKKVKDRQNERWFDMAARHKIKGKEFHVLVMGGDQVYTDDLMVIPGEMKDWADLWHSKQVAAKWSRKLEKQVDEYFTQLYVQRWNQAGPREMLQSIPYVAMWDDHDITDGWGSYPQDLHECDVYQNLFRLATRYYRLFQQQLAEDEVHPSAVPNQSPQAKGFSLAYSGLGEVAFLVPDLRSERHPDLQIAGGFSPTQIASEYTWDAIFAWLDQLDTSQHKHLIVYSSLPVAYLDLNAAEVALNALPGQWELEDDLRDHWRSKPHRDERQRLIKRLLNFSAKGTRVTIVSGDVHVAAAAVIESSLPQHGNGAGAIFQLVSTGIVHTPPPAVAVYFMEKFGAGEEVIEYGVKARMLPIGFKGHYLVPERNWLSLEPDGKGRIWANWHVEGHDHLLTQVIDPVVLPTMLQPVVVNQ